MKPRRTPITMDPEHARTKADRLREMEEREREGYKCIPQTPEELSWLEIDLAWPEGDAEYPFLPDSQDSE